LTKNFRPKAQNMNLFLLASIAIVVNNSVNSAAVGRNPPSKTLPKDGFHMRNKHRNRYDFPFLKSTNPSLVPFVAVNKYGDESIEFSNPLAVTALNKVSLLRRCRERMF
jgi:RNA methyltransferase